VDSSTGEELLRKPPPTAPEDVLRRSESIAWERCPLPVAGLPSNMRENIDGVLKAVLKADDFLQLRPEHQGR
jgi:hypothetical protein